MVINSEERERVKVSVSEERRGEQLIGKIGEACEKGDSRTIPNDSSHVAQAVGMK